MARILCGREPRSFKPATPSDWKRRSHFLAVGADTPAEDAARASVQPCFKYSLRDQRAAPWCQRCIGVAAHRHLPVEYQTPPSYATICGPCRALVTAVLRVR